MPRLGGRTGGAAAVTTPKNNLANGRSLVATGLAINYAVVQAPQNGPATIRTPHVASVTCSDLRLQYNTQTYIETDGPGQPITLEVGLEYPLGGTIYPVTWVGRNTVTIESGTTSPISDPVPVEIPAGATFYVRTFQSTPFGAYAPLAAAAAIGDTLVTLTKLPAGLTAAQIAQAPVGTVTIGSGGTAEQAVVTSYSGTANPFTANLLAPLTKAHAAADVFGGQTLQSIVLFGDQAGAGYTSNTNQSKSGTLGGLSVNSATTVAASAAGDSILKLNVAPAGTTYVVDTAGLQETVTVRQLVGTANPYTAYLTAPMTFAHASGVTVTAGSTAAGLAPSAIVADRTSTPAPPAVILIGDSIPDGTGYNSRTLASYATNAHDAANRPYLKMTKAGESAQIFAGPAASRRRRLPMTLAGWMFYEYGVNDLYGSRTLAQLQADTTTIIGWAKQRGLKVAVATLTPRTSSTDAWLTTANQTITLPASNTLRIAYNAWVRAGAGGLADLVVEIADRMETARDSGIWLADSLAPYTADGIHLSKAGHDRVQVTYAAALALMV